MFRYQFPTYHDIFKTLCTERSLSKIWRELKKLSDMSSIPILSEKNLTKPRVVDRKKKKSKFHASEYHQQRQNQCGHLVEIQEISSNFVKDSLLPRRFEVLYQEYQQNHPNAPNLNDCFNCFPKELYEAADDPAVQANTGNNRLTKIVFKGPPKTEEKEVDLEFFIDQITTRVCYIDKELNPEYVAEVMKKEEEETKAALKLDRQQKRKSNQFSNYLPSLSPSDPTSSCSKSSKNSASIPVDDDFSDFDMVDDCGPDSEPLAELGKRRKFDHLNGAYRPGIIEVHVRLVSEIGLSKVE